MGSKKIFLMRSLKRVAAMASVLSVVGGLSVGSVSAQVNQYQSINQQMQSQNYAPIPTVNSARIIAGQSNYRSQAAQQATVNRRALIGHGRMISAGYRQDSGTSGTDSPKPDRTVLQLEDDAQDFFGGDQPVPTVPRNDIPQIPAPKTPDTQQRQDGELSPDIFANPFENEKRPKPNDNSVEIPGEMLPENPETPSDEEDPADPNTEQANPFIPKTKPDDGIDYQSGRGFNTTRSRSNVYRPPGSDRLLGSDRSTQPDNGIYFVPAYDPIPGTHQSTLAPPALIDPQYGHQQQQAWPDQYASPRQPQYVHPQYQQSPYQPQYQQPPYQPQYQQPPYQPQYQQPPSQYAYPPQDYSPDLAVHPEQQVYSPVVQPPTSMACNNGIGGPMTTARRGLLGKLTRDLKNDLGFGDYQSCQDAGNCGGCNTGCGSSCGGCNTGCGGRGSTCPVFYFGFQAAANDTFDVINNDGSELVLDNGTAFFFSLGRMNGRNLRTEIELSFRSNDINGLLTPNGTQDLSGQLQTFSGMANAYWEFVKFPTGRFKPYIGGGVGFLSATADIRLASDLVSNADDADSSSSFAYQWMAGVNFKISNHLDLFGEYRFLDAESFGIASDLEDLSGNFGYSASSIGGGFRLKF